MAMMVAAAEQLGAGDVDRKSEDSNGYRLGECIGTGSKRRLMAS